MTTRDDQKVRQSKLVTALRAPRAYDHPVAGPIEVIETHISHVILTGRFVYKIKKPLNLGFLDFSTLAKRRYFCNEELRLNRRTAPQLYLEVVPITGSTRQPRVAGGGRPIEYAVKMRQFPQDRLANHLMRRGELTPDHLERIARNLADFHGRVAVASPDSIYGTPRQVHGPVKDNFTVLEPLISGSLDRNALQELHRWADDTFSTLQTVLSDRKSGGFIRECHGDMHLGNLVLLEDGIAAFDCIEFNPDLRWIDVMSETAFLAMDLEDHGRRDHHWRFVNAYLEHTGDYGGVRVLPYYKSYRAMVRAKISRIRLNQEGLNSAERDSLEAQYQDYVRLARSYAAPPAAALYLTCGLSGSGKTTVARLLSGSLGAVHIRSDIERKRLFGMEPRQRSRSRLNRDLYSPRATERTYARLAELSASVLDSGYPVIADATFLHARRRQRFQSIAREYGVPCLIIQTMAPESVLRTRIAPRLSTGRDASEADFTVLDDQLRTREPLNAAERSLTVTVDTSRGVNLEDVLERLRKTTANLRGAAS